MDKKIIFTLLYGILLTCNSFGQVLKKKAIQVDLNQKEYFEKFEILKKKIKIKTNDSLTYTWYAYNKIISTKAAYDGQLLNGFYKSFYFDNTFRSSGKYHNGVQDGKWITWYTNGNIKEISNWHKGRKCGLTKSFDYKGNLLFSANYCNNRLNGWFIRFENGQQVEKIKYSKGIKVQESQKNIYPIKNRIKHAGTQIKIKYGQATHYLLNKFKHKKKAPQQHANQPLTK